MWFFTQENANTKDEAAELLIPQPCIMVRGSMAEPKEAFLCIERTVLCKAPCCEIPLILMAAFYVFNMEYTQGLINVYTFLEYTLLNHSLPKDGKTKLKQFLAQMSHE